MFESYRDRYFIEIGRFFAVRLTKRTSPVEALEYQLARQRPEPEDVHEALREVALP